MPESIVIVEVEGIGTSSGVDRFCSMLPSYSDGTFRPWLTDLPDSLSERVDVLGGRAELGAFSFSVLDFGDYLTGALRPNEAQVTTLSAAATSSGTSLSVRSGSSIANGDVIYVGGEAMTVSSGGGTTTLTVARGALRSTAAAHDSGTAVYLTPEPIGRRFWVYVVDPAATSSASEVLVGSYLLEEMAVSEDANAWRFSGRSLVEALDTVVPASEVAFEIATVRVYPTLTQVALRPAEGGLLSDYRAAFGSEDHIMYARRAGADEVLELRTTLAGSAAAGRAANVARRDVTQTGEVEELAPGDTLLQVCVAEPEAPGSFRFSPGPSPSTSRSSGTWTVSAHWIDILLNVLLSARDDSDGLELTNYRATGTDWSRSNWSCLPPGFGVGGSTADIDWTALEALYQATLDFTFPRFVLGTQMPFGELLDLHFLKPLGAFVSTAGGTLTLRIPRIPLLAETAAVTLGPADLLLRPVGSSYLPRLQMTRAIGSATGSVVYEIGPTKRRVTYDEGSFLATYGQQGRYGADRRAIKIEAPSADPANDQLFGDRALTRLYHAHRPAQEIQLDATQTVWSADFGEYVSLTVGEVPDLAGSRGLTSVLALLLERSLRQDEETGAYVEARMRGYGSALRIGRIAPAATVVSVSSNAATVTANVYTETDAAGGLPATDAAAFTVGDELVLVNADGVDVTGAGTTQTITGISGNVITLDGDFGGYMTTTNAGLVLTYATFDDASATQQSRYTYAADRATLTPGTAGEVYVYGERG